MRRGPLWGLIVSVVLAAYCGVCTGPWQGVIIGAASGAAGAAANGGNIFKGALLGAISGAAFAAIGGSGWDIGFKALGHGAVGGVMSVLQGGKFGHGFASAGLTKLLNVNNIVGGAAGKAVQRVTLAAIIGGTISRATGGKFANAAVTAALAQAVNGEKDIKDKADRAWEAAHKDFGTSSAQEEERTWGSYLPGTEAGDNAAQYWADIAVKSDHPLAPLANVPGVFAALWTDQTATNTAFTLGTAGLGSLLNLGSKLGSKLFLSETFGITSTRFAHSVTGTTGSLNVTGSLFKIGWSGVSRNGGGMMLRIGLGGTGNTARFHFYVPGSFVPNSFANGSIQVKRVLHKMGQ